MLNKVSLKIKNYKCFAEIPQGFAEIKPINIIIGKNNSGKSTLLEIIELAADPTRDRSHLGHKGATPKLCTSTTVTEGQLKTIFRPEVSGGGVPGGSHWRYGSRWVGAKTSWERELRPKCERDAFVLDPPLDRVEHSISRGYTAAIGRSATAPLEGRIVKRLLAERDIRPEQESDKTTVASDGAHLTNVVRRYLNEAQFPSQLIEDEFLNEINSVLAPDCLFSRILVQRDGAGGPWEICLEEAGKGRVALSHTGSGIKTILLVVFLLSIAPKIENKKLSDYVFCLEELENNVHPSLLRRLFFYIEKKAKDTQCLFFITTHSNVVIDLFSGTDVAQLIHVRHDGVLATASRAQTYLDNKGVLDDLDVRASDLLQANVVVWVEGPSDRIYFNRWMELLSDGVIREGAHYQCVFYGGRLLAHLSGEAPTSSPENLVSVFSVNRNCVLIIDSDLTGKRRSLNETKKRIIEEVKRADGIAWVTAGKEIENYIPVSATLAFCERISTKASFAKSETYWDFLDKVRSGEGKKYKNKKVVFADKIAPLITVDGMKETHDLYNYARRVLEKIKNWNRVDQFER